MDDPESLLYMVFYGGLFIGAYEVGKIIEVCW